MKKIIVFSIIIVFIFVSMTAGAMERLASFSVSSATSVNGTGFLFGKMPENGGTRMVVEKDGTNALCLYNTAAAAANDVVVAYDTSWSSSATDHLVMTTRVKTDEISGSSTNKFISFRMDAAPHATVMQIRESSIYCNGSVVPNLTVEPGRWYDVKVALKMYPEYMIDLYIDGEKVMASPFPNLSKMNKAGLQFRMEITGPGTFYIGDTDLYVPDMPKAELENPQLSSIDEPVVISFGNSEIDVSTLNSKNIRITDNLNSKDVSFEMEQLKGADGILGAIAVTFPEGLRKDNSYTVDLSEILDVSGQQLSQLVFKTPAPDQDYKIGDVKFYSGFNTDNEITSVTEGNITVKADVANGGLQERSITLVCVLYQDSKLAGVSIAGTILAAEEQSEIMTSIYAQKADSNTKLYVMLWKGFGGDPITDAVILAK